MVKSKKNIYDLACCPHDSGTGVQVLRREHFIGSELWNRELNIYYKKLSAILNNKEKSLLKESQRSWIKERDASIQFNSIILNRDYSKQGTMYALMRAGKVDEMITPIIKERVLVLKRWYELLK